MVKALRLLEKWLGWGGTRKDMVLIALSGIGVLLSLLDMAPGGFDPAWVAIILCGIPIVLEALIGLICDHDITADVLVALALLASLKIGEIFAAGEVAFIMQLGGLLEELTVARARAGIEKLVHLTPRTARRVEGGEEAIIPAEKVQVGDVLRVLPGETIPVDGRIREGQTSVNQAVMTGESLPVDKGPGDPVSSGTVNQFGAFTMVAEKVDADSSIQRMIRLVQSADAGKAKIVGLADRWAVWVVIIAVVAAALTYLVTGKIIRSVTILVVFCPCALVLATPTAIMAGIGNVTKHGFLVREGDALERLSQVRKIAFDKTGTLTYGKPEVTSVVSLLPEVSREQLYAWTACAEKDSEHPLGKAITAGYEAESGQKAQNPEMFTMVPGQGIRASADGHEILAGNRKLLAAQGIVLPSELENQADLNLARGSTLTLVAVDGRAAGFLALTDTVRPEARDTLRELRQQTVEPVLLTGDHQEAARTIAGQLGIATYRADCLPEEKLAAIDRYQEQGEPVCMIGDGINDAPALKKAMVGIAMGGVGSDIAMDAADIVLVDDEVKELPHLLALSHKMMRTIHHNLAFSMTLNFIAIALAMTGLLNPVTGALVHNAGSVFVIINSAFLLKWHRREVS